MSVGNITIKTPTLNKLEVTSDASANTLFLSTSLTAPTINNTTITTTTANVTKLNVVDVSGTGVLDYTDISNNTITVHDSLTVQNNKLSDKLGLGTTTPNVILEIVDTGSVFQ